MPKKHILICDDEFAIRESIKEYLDSSYELSIATNGQEAINAVMEKEFDLLIIDIKMPVMDGLEAIRQIKNAKPGQKIIVLTGYETISIAEESAKRGVNAYLAKPIGKEKLLKVVAETIQ
jgi:YesN/AraC family two-component response regulator